MCPAPSASRAGDFLLEKEEMKLPVHSPPPVSGCPRGIGQALGGWVSLCHSPAILPRCSAAPEIQAKFAPTHCCPEHASLPSSPQALRPGAPGPLVNSAGPLPWPVTGTFQTSSLAFQTHEIKDLQSWQINDIFAT